MYKEGNRVTEKYCIFDSGEVTRTYGFYGY